MFIKYISLYVTFIKYLFTIFLYDIFIHFICFIIGISPIIYYTILYEYWHGHYIDLEKNN